MEKYVFKCKDCGSKRYKKVGQSYVCEYCGYREEVYFDALEKRRPEPEVKPAESEVKPAEPVAVVQQQPKPQQPEPLQQTKPKEQEPTRLQKIIKGIFNDTLLKLLVCIFLGYLGIHKFVEGKVGMGFLYMFTVGLFGIGYIIDIATYAFAYLGSIINGLVG